MNANRTPDPIVISAFGAVTPLGGDERSLIDALREGRSGIRKIEKFECASFATAHAGVPLEGNVPMHCADARRIPLEHRYAELAAKRLANRAPGIRHVYAPDRLGCFVGVDTPATDVQSALDLIERLRGDKSHDAVIETLARHLRMRTFLDVDAMSILGVIHRQFAFSGCAVAHVGLCAASLQAIGLGMRAIRQGRVDAAIVGGVSGKVNPIHLARLELLDVVSTDVKLAPGRRSRPFDRRRSGFVLAEGAVLLLLERASRARERGLDHRVGVVGFGASLGAEHLVIPHRQSLEMRLAMQRALGDAGCLSTDIQYINAHGTSTVLNDRHESDAIRTLFPTRPDIPVTANKSLHGHLIATAGAMEVLSTALCMREGFIPGTINLDEQDPECTVHVVREATPAGPGRVLKNSFGMGGLAASLILELQA